MLRSKKLFSPLFLLTFISLFFLPTRPAKAGFSWPKPRDAFQQVMGANPGVQIMNQIMGDMGMDKQEARTTVSQINTQRQKQNPPQVSLSFFPPNPSPGEEVTVTATPTYFASAAENLYFTWYLKHDGGNDDLNGDGNTDVEDYKVEAARLIANGGWDWDPEGDGLPNGPSYTPPETDDDGYEASFGGEDQKNKGTPHCYIHNWPSGEDYELPTCEHLFPDDGIDVLGGGDEDFEMDQEQFWRTDPRNNDTRGATQKDEATVVGLGVFEFKFNYRDGDKIGVAVEGASYQPTSYDDSTYKVFWALVRNECEIGAYLPDEDHPTGRSVDNDSVSTTAEGAVNAPAATCAYFDYTPFGICQPDNLQYRTVTAASSIDPDGGSITPDGCTGGTPFLTQGCTYGYAPDPDCASFTYNASFGACQPNGFQYTTVATTTPADCSGGAVPALSQACVYTPPLPTSGVADDADAIPADGIDPAEWLDSGYLQIGTEIIRYNTFGTSRTFGSSGSTFLFSNLQRGVSPTTAAFHADNATITGNTTIVDTETITDTSFSAQTNEFLVTTTTNTTTTVRDVRGQIIEGPTTVTAMDEETIVNSESFDMPVSRINDCLEYNMLSPAEGNADEKLKINLFYTPKAPMNSPAGDDSDFLTVSAGLENAQNEDYLIYDWKVYGFADDPSTDLWTQIPKASLPESTQTHGVGLKNFQFKLQFPQADIPTAKYMKVKLTITEKRPGQATTQMQGNASVVIPIAPLSYRMGVYSSTPQSGTLAPQVDLFDAGLRCDTGVQGAVCPVVKDEIVGLRIDAPGGGASGAFTDIVWTVNGEVVSYPECFFVGCPANATNQINKMFIPILKDIGTQYIVGVTAVDPDGEKLNLTRTLEVVEPAMQIVSDDQGIGTTGARAVFLGTYVPLDPASVPTTGATALEDFSETDFQALQGQTANFSMVFNVPAQFRDNAKTNWFVDGQESGNTGNLSLPVAKEVGRSYSITANTIYRQDPLIMQMLNYYWGVGFDQIYEKQMSYKVDLSVVNNITGAMSDPDTNKTLPKKMLAALTFGAPSYLIFLFRIVLTTGLLLFFIRLVLSFIPKNYEA